MKKDKIIFVDGFKIRNTLDDDFGLIHRHSPKIAIEKPKFYIPEGEIWFDHPFKAELDFMLKVDKFTEPDNNHSYREKRELAKKTLTLPGPIPDFIRKKETINGLNILYVDGSIIRKYLDPEFIFGGHDLVYSYISRSKIWLDIFMDPREIPYILEHEKIERELMVQGKTYEIAHEYAIVADKELRKKDGFGCYPGDPNYPWYNLSNKEIIEKYYVIREQK